MNRREHLLACLAEECDEVGQRVMKALRFGLRERQKGQPLTNADRIAEELRDLLSVAVIAEREGILPIWQPTERDVQAKLERIERYMEVSRREGALQDDA